MTTTLNHTLAKVQLLVGDHTLALCRVSRQQRSAAPGAAEFPRRAAFQILVKDSPSPNAVAYELMGHPVEAAALAEAIEWCRAAEHPNIPAEPFDIWFGEAQLRVSVELKPEYHVVVEMPHNAPLRMRTGHMRVIVQALRSLAAIRSQSEKVG